MGGDCDGTVNANAGIILFYAEMEGIIYGAISYSQALGFREYVFSRENFYIKDAYNPMKYIFYDEYRPRFDEQTEQLHSSIAEYTVSNNPVVRVHFENLVRGANGTGGVLLSRSLTPYNNRYYSFVSFLEKDFGYAGKAYVSAINLACIVYDTNFNRLSHTVWRIPVNATPNHSPPNPSSDWFVTKVISEKLQSGFLVGISFKTKNNSTSSTLFGIVPYNLSNINGVVKLVGLPNTDNLYKSFHDGYGNVLISIKGSNDIIQLSDSITSIPTGALPDLPSLSFQPFTEAAITNVSNTYVYKHYTEQQTYSLLTNNDIRYYTNYNVVHVTTNLSSPTASTVTGNYSEF